MIRVPRALFSRSIDRHVLRFLSWAQRDVRKPWQTKRDALMTGAATAARTSSMTQNANPNA